MKTIWLSIYFFIGALFICSNLHASPLLLQYDNFTGSAQSKVNTYEQIDGGTVGNNVVGFSGVALTGAEFILSDDYSTVTINSIDMVVNSSPVTMNGIFDLGFYGLKPFSTTVSNIDIAVNPQGATATVGLDGSFEALSLQAIYNWDYTLDFDGTITNSHVSKTAFLDIELGDFDLMPNGDINLMLSGDSGALEVIYHEVYGPYTAELKQTVFLNSYNFTASTQPLAVVPEPISSILFAAGGTLLAGRRYMRKKTKHNKNMLLNAQPQHPF